MDSDLVGMDSNNWRSTQGGEPAVDTGDWRSQLPPDSRQRIVNKIMDTLKRHLPFHGPDGLQELKKIAIRFEEKIYSAAISQTDYLRKISLKMLTMETKSQNSMVNPAQPTSAISNNKNPQDPGSHSMQSQAGNQGQQMPMPMGNNQVQARQQLISQNIQNNIAPGGVQQGSSGLTSGMTSINGLPSTNMPNVASQNPNIQNMQNMSGVQQNLVGNTMGQGISSNMMVNSQQRQMQGAGRQQIMPQQAQQQQQQQQQSQNYLYQQQLQQQLMKPKYQGNLSHSSMQSHVQQQQSQQQPNIMQSSSQQQVMQPSTIQSGSLSGLQQNQQISVQQPTQTGLQQNSQAVFRQQQQQNSMIHQQQQTGQPMQQHQLIGQQSNANNMQQQLTGPQNNISDMQQQQQQQRMLSQQNNLPNMQSQQQLMSQTNNLSNVHHQSMGSLNNVVGLPQQSLVTQPGSSNLQTNQHSLPIMQQPKIPLQQQSQQGNTTLLPNLGGQTSQQQTSSQQSMAQIQSQTGQLQQQLGMQQQSSSVQRDMQQRHQTSGPLLQQQNMIDQQKQIFQSQRAVSEASSTSLDSTVQTGTANSGDWQEEIFQKVKSLKETYLPELAEMYQKISFKLQQHDPQPQQPKNEQAERLKIFKTMLERIISVLQITKNNISLSYRDKLPSYEKQIINFLNSNRPRKQGPIMPQGQQLGQSQMQSMQQQHSQMQPHENQMNTQQLQQMSMQNPITAMTGLQQNPMPPSLTGIQNSLQPSSNDSGQGNHLNNMQQPVSVGSLQQNPMSVVPQQVNMNNVLQQNLSSVVQSNASGLPSQHIKQEQNMLQNQQPMKQQQQRQIQQQLMQRQLYQQQQQQTQQMKQQQTAQLQPHQISQLHQMSDMSDLKIRQQLANKQQQRSQLHQQVKSTTNSFPISSPQLLPTASSPQLFQNPSPQIDQQNMLSSLTKTGTPLQSINSPYIIPSPPTPLVPSPMPGESEKVVITNIGHPTALSSQSLAIGTPGISASPLLESTSPENHVNPFAVASGKSSITELPMDRLLRVVKSMSPSALSDSVRDIGSIVGMFDRIAGSAPGNGSRAAVGEDLAAMTKCRLQARNFAMQDGANGMRRMKRYTTANFVTGSENSDAESTATSGVKWPRLAANHSLLEEIRKINERLIETVVDISDDEEVDPIASAAAAAEGGEGTIVKCSYAAVALSPTFKAHYASAKMSQIQPLRLLVPNNYPNCSPIFMDKFPTEPSKESEDLSAKTKSRFSISLRTLSQPMSLGEIAKMWDVCARAVILEYAQQNGGGSFSSKYGSWDNCFSTVE
ncbi:mediator of RNA polymerase II transcription subunit 15a [Impatiens glandulifera]|uniref:mediator of RNA polymerase II transcription subunit 15a n=1 Tax=Impatiens glandulifera TaxID=253017 RepID=UPI001FB17964|nr:mediator of RNA polymerase II transcription subunit 15a [Impatiens glandulifera]XP_047321627.1 mediator of RNA polymerase II transcription subunit 15a [Impatiens glandulifera]